MPGRNSATIVLGCLLLSARACKDDAASSGAGAATDATGAAGPDDGTVVDAAPSGAGAPATASAEPSKPVPPPSGHAVAKVGALMFTSSTGEVGFELPPLPGDAPGMALNVVGEQDGRLVVETFAVEPAEQHCTTLPDGIIDFRLRLFLDPADLLPVTTKEYVHEFGDGTSVRLVRGVPVPPGWSQVRVRGSEVEVTVPPEVLGRVYEPGITNLPQEGHVGILAPMEGHPLTYDGKELEEFELYGAGGDVHYYAITLAGGERLVTVRNPCVEIVALVSADRVDAPVKVPRGYRIVGPGSLETLEALEERAEAEGVLGGVPGGVVGGVMGELSDEDVWGGLTGAEIGETYGLGGLGLVGVRESAYEVKAGTPILWSDGRAAGQVAGDHRFTEAPREHEGRSCFEVPLTEQHPSTVTLCFVPADVSAVAVAVGSSFGIIGSIGGSTEGGGLGGGGGGGIGLGGRGFGSRGGKRVPTVRQAKAAVKGSLDKDIIRRIVRAHVNEVRFCYEQGLTRDPALKGRVVVDFTIGPDGKVSVSDVSTSTLADAAVGTCIAKAVKRWAFPRPPGGDVAVVAYPFVLDPG